MDRHTSKIGSFLQIPNVGRGQLKYVGPVQGKPDIYAGIDLLANIGKNNGSFDGKQYFTTEYPRSGLFIQLQKIVHLLEEQNNDVRVSSMDSDTSSASTVIKKPQFSLFDPNSPTPQRVPSRSDSGSIVDGMDVDLSSSSRKHAANDHLPVKKDYELQLEKKTRQLEQYKKLLDEQRILLEELQPAIDMYESNLQSAEEEVKKLKQQLHEESEKRKQQKEYFEVEHEQVLAVVEQLHQEIKYNEKRAMENDSKLAERQDTTELMNELNDLRQCKKDFERAKEKWGKERDQLNMHNSSLNKEYQALYKELIEAKDQLGK